MADGLWPLARACPTCGGTKVECDVDATSFDVGGMAAENERLRGVIERVRANVQAFDDGDVDVALGLLVRLLQSWPGVQLTDPKPWLGREDDVVAQLDLDSHERLSPEEAALVRKIIDAEDGG